MKLPELECPEKYAGLYVFDFGDDQTVVGYTADEIAILLESEQYPDGKVYRIHRALPDGTMELQGIARERFLAEEGMFFHRRELEPARRDFERLDELARQAPPPCRVKVHLATLGKSLAGQAEKTPGPGQTWMTAMIYPAEYSHEISKWLRDAGYGGGDYVEGGISMVTDYYGMGAGIIDRRQLWPGDGVSRQADEVLSTTHLPVQRRMAG